MSNKPKVLLNDSDRTKCACKAPSQTYISVFLFSFRNLA